MNKPRISIIIPAFNVESYVEAALQSVFQQTEAPCEILVFDDGSTDGTSDILEKYVNYPNFRLFSQDNIGQGEARNRGARCARGDYLYFFDADDLLDRHFVGHMQQVILRHDSPDLILFSGAAFTEDDHLSAWVDDNSYRRGCEAQGVTGCEALVRLESGRGLSPSPSLYLAKASFWKGRGFCFPATIYEDQEVFVPLVLSAQVAVIEDTVMFYRRYRPGSIMTGQLTERHVQGRESNLRQAIKDMNLAPDSEKRCKKVLRNQCRNAAVTYFRTAGQVGCPVNKRLLWRAIARTRSTSLFKKALLGVPSKKEPV